MKNLQKMKYSTHPIKSKMIYSLEQGIEPWSLAWQASILTFILLQLISSCYTDIVCGYCCVFIRPSITRRARILKKSMISASRSWKVLTSPPKATGLPWECSDQAPSSVCTSLCRHWTLDFLQQQDPVELIFARGPWSDRFLHHGGSCHWGVATRGPNVEAPRTANTLKNQIVTVWSKKRQTREKQQSEYISRDTHISATHQITPRLDSYLWNLFLHTFPPYAHFSLGLFDTIHDQHAFFFGIGLQRMDEDTRGRHDRVSWRSRSRFRAQYPLGRSGSHDCRRCHAHRQRQGVLPRETRGAEWGVSRGRERLYLMLEAEFAWCSDAAGLWRLYGTGVYVYVHACVRVYVHAYVLYVRTQMSKLVR